MLLQYLCITWCSLLLGSQKSKSALEERNVCKDANGQSLRETVSVNQRTLTIHKGKNHCKACLKLNWIGFDQTNNYVVVGPWWWSSGQRACLLLRRSEFESRWGLQFFCKIVIEKNKNKNKKRPGLAHFFKKNMLFCMQWNYLIQTSQTSRTVILHPMANALWVNSISHVFFQPTSTESGTAAICLPNGLPVVRLKTLNKLLNYPVLTIIT